MKLFSAIFFFFPLFGDIGGIIMQEALKEAAKKEQPPKETPPVQGLGATGVSGLTGATGPITPLLQQQPTPQVLVAPGEADDNMPLKPKPPVSRMPHIPNEDPIQLQDKGNFMSHPHPQKKTLPDSAVFPPTHMKNSG